MSLCTCSREGWIRAKRSVRAALKGTAPPMARRVLGGRPTIRLAKSDVPEVHTIPPKLLQRPPTRKALPRAPPHSRRATMPWARPGNKLTESLLENHMNILRPRLASNAADHEMVCDLVTAGSHGEGRRDGRVSPRHKLRDSAPKLAS